MVNGLELKIVLNGLEDKVNRIVEVNDDMDLELFCEHVIISMNGNGKELYSISKGMKNYYCYKDDIEESMNQKYMEGKTLKDLKLDEGNVFGLSYDSVCYWEFSVKVNKVSEKKYKEQFNIVSASGIGILEGCDNFSLIEDVYMKHEITEYQIEMSEKDYEGFRKFYENRHKVNKLNEKVKTGITKLYDSFKPKSYVMNVVLDEYEDKISRKILVNGDLPLDLFCECVVLSMRGDLSHEYALKLGRKALSHNVLDEQDIIYLELKKNQSFKVIYDYGDNWVFNVRVSSIKEEESDVFFTVLDGKGYGIVEDIGGSWNLSQVFEGKLEDFEQVDIDDFSTDEINEMIDEYLY